MKKSLRKAAAICLAAVMALGTFTGCGSSSDSNSATDSDATDLSSKEISVLSREEGSGTRGAFIELFGIEEEDESGEKVDNTVQSAEITNSTSVMMTTVAGNVGAIGYVSLGSLDDSVKALKIDGAEATVENIKSGSYKIARPFNVVYTDSLSELGQDFLAFVMSEEGQAVVEEAGYISEGNEGAYAGSKPSGKITVAGSSSVTPVMEKLKEAYIEINPDAEIEVQQSDSSTGISNAASGVSDIGMASRELKDEETSQGLTSLRIAMDGIAVIVNLENTADDLTSDQIRSIFTGETTSWGDILG